MDSTVEALLAQLRAVNEDIRTLVEGLDARRLNWSPDGRRWSAGQALEHLSITTDRYLPVLDQAIASLVASGRRSTGAPTLGWFDRLFLRVLEPPVRLRVKAPAAFVAGLGLDPSATWVRWTDTQEAFADRIRRCEGLDLKGVSVRSQFGPVSFSLYASFAILLAHQRRHAWQIRQLMRDASFPQ